MYTYVYIARAERESIYFFFSPGLKSEFRVFWFEEAWKGALCAVLYDFFDLSYGLDQKLTDIEGVL